METLEELKKLFDNVMEFGDIPRFSTEIYHRRLYVCRNNGQFHRGDMDGRGGWATFVGKFTRRQGLEFLSLNGYEVRDEKNYTYDD